MVVIDLVRRAMLRGFAGSFPGPALSDRGYLGQDAAVQRCTVYTTRLSAGQSRQRIS